MNFALIHTKNSDIYVYKPNNSEIIMVACYTLYVSRYQVSQHNYTTQTNSHMKRKRIRLTLMDRWVNPNIQNQPHTDGKV